MRILKSLVAVAALAVPVGDAAAPPETPVLAAGPALVGRHVTWGERRGAEVELRLSRAGARPRTIYRESPTVDGASLSLDGLAASPTLIAFRRRFGYCPRSEPGIVYPCRGKTAVLAAAPAQPFRNLVVNDCGTSIGGADESLDVTGSLVASLETYCRGGVSRRRIVVRTPGAAPVVVKDDLSQRLLCCANVSAAGRYVAWAEEGGVDVYDLRARRIAYRPALRQWIDRLSVQRDGTLAVLFQVPGHDDRVAWLSPKAPVLHVLAMRVPVAAQPLDVDLADGRIVVERAVSPSVTQLVVSDLAGHVRTLARFGGKVRRVGTVDFDGQRVTWASELVLKTEVRCPRVGLGPCIAFDSGLRSLWVARIGPHAVTRQLITRQAFENAGGGLD